jgi:hypothetical protein
MMNLPPQPGPQLLGGVPGNLRHQRNLRRVSRSTRDVEDLELELLARIPAAREIVAFLGADVVDDRHRREFTWATSFGMCQTSFGLAGSEI